MKNIYKNIVLLFLLVVPCFSAFGQDHAVSEKIEKIVEEAITQASKPLFFFEKIEAAEKLAKNNNNPLDYFRIYKAKALFYSVNNNEEDCRIYVDKFKPLMRYCKEPLELAKTYEELFIFENSYRKDAIKDLFKAYALFKQYGKPEDLIDVNYNLSQEYLGRKEWGKSINHAIRGIELIKLTGQKNGNEKYLYLYLLKSYTALENYDKAAKALKAADSIRQEIAKPNYFTFEYIFYGNALNFYNKTKQYKKAAEISDTAFKALSARLKSEEKKVKRALRLEKDLILKKDELKHISLENKLKKAEIKIAYIIIIFITILLVFLIFLSLYLKRNSKTVIAFNKELERKNADLAGVTAKLEDALKAKTEFLNVMTHELFTPINGIAIIAQNLKTKDNKNDLTQNLELLEFSSNYLYRLLKNIVDTKFIEKKALSLSVDALNFKHFISSVAKTANVFLKTSTNKFQYYIDIDIPDPLLVDSVKLSQILINLLNNANKFTTNGKISLYVNLEKETESQVKILFKIIDTGIGLDPKTMKHIFDKFSHGSEEIKKKYGGSGIGLYVVKHFLLLHNSQIMVESEKGKITTFSFSIWFDKAFETGKSDIALGQKTKADILLVDDNKINLILTKKLLESNGYSCDIQESGFDAIEALRAKKYDLILMDIMMPGINGFETTIRIKHMNIQTPIIALTAIDMEQNQEDFEQANFIAVLNKPLVSENFFKTIKKVIADHRTK